MSDDSEPPNPTEYGSTPDELTRLGKALQGFFQTSYVKAAGKASWSDLDPLMRAMYMEKLRFPSYGTGIKVFYGEAQRCAAEGKLRLAGKHYKSWFNLNFLKYSGMQINEVELPAVRRLCASIKANAQKQIQSSDKAVQVFQTAIEVLKKRSRSRSPSTNDLAKQVSRSTGIPHETVRGFLKRAGYKQSV